MEATQGERTLAQVFSWTKRFLGYTDMVCESVPEEQEALRPVDPKGGYVFSALEQAAHIADTRWMFVGWITGENTEARQFMQEFGGPDKAWEFSPLKRADVLASLKEGHTRVDQILSWPESRLTGTTDASEKAHQERLKELRAAGKETAEVEAAGPGTVANMVLFLIAHEQSHRAVLQHMLRISGAEVARMA